MKLKAPAGIGDPCVEGVTLVAAEGLYEVAADVGALLIECFGFVAIEQSAAAMTRANADKPKAALASRRARTAARKAQSERT